MKRKLKHLEPFDYVVLVILTVWVAIIIYPFWNAFLSSVVTVKEYADNPAMIWPKQIILENYEYIIENGDLIKGYANTILLVAGGTAFALASTVTMSYALSRKNLRGRKWLFGLAFFTMLFNGGLIPTYLNIRNLGLMDSLVGIGLMYGVNTYYMILIKNSFEQLPDSIYEAAALDGANDLTIFFRIMLPMIKPTLVTFALFIAVDYWNEWYYSMLLIMDTSKMPLQVILRNIVVQSSLSTQMMSGVNLHVNSNGVKMAAVMLTMLPVMLVYPFVQKYFVKGITAGSVKM